MTPMIMWRVVLTFCALIPALWMSVLVGRFFVRTWGGSPPAWTSWVRFELDPLIPAMIVISIMFDHTTGQPDTRWYTPLVIAANLAFWWFMRKDDDDDDERWHKRRKRLTARIRAMAGRLVVTPT